MTIWFTADQHFNHAGIISFCERPFSLVAEMNEYLINQWNECVKTNDTIYVLGDFAFFSKKSSLCPILERLKGKKHLIEGNHDRQNKVSNNTLSFWESISPYLEITVQDREAWQGRQRITMCHYPMVTWRERQRGGWMLHGHAHGTFRNEVRCADCDSLIFSDCKRLDVGVDVTNYRPISYEEIKTIMNDKGKI